MRTNKRHFQTLAFIAALTFGSASAQEMNYQGRLTDNTGAPLADGQYKLTFWLYDAAEDGNLEWGPFTADGSAAVGHGPMVELVNGRFNTAIGPEDASGDLLADFLGNGDRYLQLKVENNSPITPRQKMLSAPIALHAITADRAQTAANFTSEVLFTDESNLRVGVGVPAPNSRLHVNGDSTDPALRVQVNGSSKLLVNTNGGTSIGRNNLNPPADGLEVEGDVIVGGNVGVGTPSPVRMLHLNGPAPEMQFTDTEASNQGWHMGPINDGFHIVETNLASRITIAPGGNVGIGTVNPTRGKLEVSGTASSLIQNYAILHPNGTIGTVGATTNNRTVGIYASGAIAADRIVSFSDERIKNVIGRSDSGSDLETINKIAITDYTLKDMVAKGTQDYKKVIAQQVEEVFPQAVTQSTDVIPDIYQNCPVTKGWVSLASDLEKGERVRLIGEKEEGVYEVLEVRDGAFRTAFQPSADKVFVYGREVDDFRCLDYEAIAMLNVSATQELARKVSALETEKKARDAEIVALKAQLAGQARLIEIRLSALERALPASTPRTVKVTARK